MARVQLVAESLQEWVESSLVESTIEAEELNEGLVDKWPKMDKSNEKLMKKVASKINALTQGGTGLKVLKQRIAGAKLDKLVAELEKASKVKFKGNWVLVGDDFAFKPKKEMKLKSDMAHGGTQGKTSAGGV